MKHHGNFRSLRIACAAAVLGLGLGAGPASAAGSHSHDHAAKGAQVSGVVVTAAHSPAVAPGIRTAAVYMVLENTGGAPVDLTAVESPAFAMGHIHKSSMVGGLMTMEVVAQLTVPADAHVVFEPGGLHIMLMGPSKSLKAGDTFSMTLIFGSGEQLEVPVAVVKPGMMPAHDHGSMKMN